MKKHKKLKELKPHIIFDTLGLILRKEVGAGSVQDRHTSFERLKNKVIILFNCSILC